MPGALTIISGKPDPDTMEAVGKNAELVFLPREEYGPYEAFIRRSEALRSAARSSCDTALVDFGYTLRDTTAEVGALDEVQERMLERVARGLGATILGSRWCGVAPQVLPPNPGPGIGSWEAQVLLVGSGPAQAGEGPYWPYISSRPDGPAAWLTEQIGLVGVDESDLYWVNAQTIVDGVLVNETPDRLLSRPWGLVLCMGEEAVRWAKDFGFPRMASAPYPTWWWNYRRGREYPGASEVRRAVQEVRQHAPAKDSRMARSFI